MPEQNAYTQGSQADLVSSIVEDVRAGRPARGGNPINFSIWQAAKTYGPDSPEFGQWLDKMDIKHQTSNTLGGVVGRYIAPAALAMIPGIGTMTAAGLAAGANAGGQLFQNGRINPVESLTAGAATYGGRSLLNSALGPKPGMVPSGVGNATQSGGGIGDQTLSQVGNASGGALPGSAYESFPGLDPGMSGGDMGGGSYLDRILGGGGEGSGFLDKVLKYGPGIVGGIGAANRQHESDQMMQDAVRGAQAEWAARAPLRAFSQEQILGLPGIQRPDMSKVFADPGNPFYRPG